MKVLFILMCLIKFNLSFCQISYTNYLIKHKQIDLSKEDLFEPQTLLGGQVIMYSRDDSSIYVNLVGSTIIKNFYHTDGSAGKKKVGGVCADFANSFFFGHYESENLIGRLYQKKNPLVKSTVLGFIDKSIPKQKLLVFDLGKFAIGKVELKLIDVSKNKFQFFELSNFEINDLRFLRIKSFTDTSIELKDVRNMSRGFHLTKSGNGHL